MGHHEGVRLLAKVGAKGLLGDGPGNVVALSTIPKRSCQSTASRIHRRHQEADLPQQLGRDRAFVLAWQWVCTITGLWSGENRVAGDVDPIDGARRIRDWRCGRQEFGWLTPGRRSSVLPSLLASRWHRMVPMRQYPPRSVALGVLPRPEPFVRCLFGPPQAFRPKYWCAHSNQRLPRPLGIRTLPKVGSTLSRDRSRRSKKSSRPSESHWASWLTRLASIVGREILKTWQGPTRSKAEPVVGEIPRERQILNGVDPSVPA